MKKEDIVRMAGEAGFVIDEKAQQHQPNCIFHTHHMVDELLERFAALVAAAEREACADICEQHASIEGIAQRCAAEIRARGETK
jgi:uncharacterized protein YfcZ (UPF0381/DUF406 family)